MQHSISHYSPSKHRYGLLFSNLSELIYQKLNCRRLPRISLIVALGKTLELETSMMNTLETSLSMDTAAQKHVFELIVKLGFLKFPLPTTVSRVELNHDLVAFITPLWPGMAFFFPRLKHLSIAKQTDGTKPCWTPLHPFIDAIHTHCPRIQTMELNNEYSVT
jgi:hypothetical protein